MKILELLECKPTIKLIIIVVVMFVIAGLTSCRSPDVSRTTFIRDTTYTIIPPVIIDSGRAEIQLRNTNDELRKNLDSMFIPASQDTIYRYVRVEAGDTVRDIRFVPSTRWFYYKVRPDTIYKTARDTLTKCETVEKKIETPWMAKMGIFSAGAIAVLMVILAIYLINWYKFGRIKPATTQAIARNDTIAEAKNDGGLL